LDVSWQTTVVFEFTTTVHYLGNAAYTYVFDLEDTEGFGGRKPIGSATTEEVAALNEMSLHIVGGNTINPCPPSDTNCGSL
jgi:hypothetical protein